MRVADLLAYLFDGQPHLLAEPMAMWVASSRRFAAFATAFRSKIRKKLRAAQEAESLRDLALELETAYLLLRERSLSVVYEPLPEGQARGPDFAVAFTTSAVFMLEVARLRRVQDGAPASKIAPVLPLAGERLADTVCSKLGQLLPQHSNILLVGLEAPYLVRDDLRAAMLRLQQRAEGGDATSLQRYGFRDRADFFHRYRRLSEVLVRGPHLQAAEPVVAWVNPQANHPLPSRVRTVLYRSHTG